MELSSNKLKAEKKFTHKACQWQAVQFTDRTMHQPGQGMHHGAATARQGMPSCERTGMMLAHELFPKTKCPQ
jgi:hypothetical protein